MLSKLRNLRKVRGSIPRWSNLDLYFFFIGSIRAEYSQVGDEMAKLADYVVVTLLKW